MSACLRDLYTVLLPAVLYAAQTCMRDVWRLALVVVANRHCFSSSSQPLW
jgi:hypothetical protein